MSVYIITNLCDLEETTITSTESGCVKNHYLPVLWLTSTTPAHDAATEAVAVKLNLVIWWCPEKHCYRPNEIPYNCLCPFTAASFCHVFHFYVFLLDFFMLHTNYCSWHTAMHPRRILELQGRHIDTSNRLRGNWQNSLRFLWTETNVEWCMEFTFVYLKSLFLKFKYCIFF